MNESAVFPLAGPPVSYIGCCCICKLNLYNFKRWIFCNTDCRRPASVWNIPGLMAPFQFLWRPRVMFVSVSGHCFSAAHDGKWYGILNARFIINPRLISSLLAKMLKELFKTFSHYSALHHTRWTRCSVEENVPVLMIWWGSWLISVRVKAETAAAFLAR